MQTKFKRHQNVILLQDPDPEYIEYYEDVQEPILKGMHGKVNMLLPNGKYHVEIDNPAGEIIAYVVLDEDGLQAVE